MPLTACVDTSPARWLEGSELPCEQLVTFGPSGFAAYARLRFVADPGDEDQAEAAPGVLDEEAEQLRTLFDVLAGHTRTPHDCYFCLWDGLVDEGGDGQDASVRLRDLGPVYFDDLGPVASPDPRARPGVLPEHRWPARLPGPVVNVPNRSYYLFQGRLAEAGDWAVPEGWPAQPSLDITCIAFAWPADRAWCLAADVDPHWAGIGADTAVVEQLVADPRLDVVPADPGVEQPAYP